MSGQIRRVVDQSLVDSAAPWRPRLGQSDGSLVGETVLVEVGLANRAPTLDAVAHSHPIAPLDVDVDSKRVCLPVGDQRDRFLAECVVIGERIAAAPTTIHDDWTTDYLPLTALEGDEFGGVPLDDSYDVPALDVELLEAETVRVSHGDEVLVEPSTTLTFELDSRAVRAGGTTRMVAPLYTVTNYGRVDVFGL